MGETISSVASQLITGEIPTSASVPTTIPDATVWQSMLTTKYFYIGIVAVALIPIVIKRSLGEFPFVSYLLTISVVLFIIITAVDLGMDQSQAYPLNEFVKPIYSDNIINGVSILCTAYSYQTSVFPAYTSLIGKSTERFLLCSWIANAFCFVVYTTLGILCVAMFGDNINVNILLNMATRSGVSSIILRIVFSCLLITHIPYVFFVTN